MDRNRGGVQAVGAASSIVTATLTRPSDTNAYAAGDIVANATSNASVITFSNCARILAGTGVVTAAVMIDSAAPVTKLDAELYLFSSSPATDDDNEALNISDSDALKLIGVIDFGGDPYVTGANCIYQQLGVNIMFECAAASKDLYGILVARNIYTPVSAEVFTIKLKVSQD